MKTSTPSIKRKINTALWAKLGIAIAAAAVTTQQASALLTYDLRAQASNPGFVTSKLVNAGDGAVVTFDMYAVVTGADNNPNNDGLQFCLFSIISESNTGYSGSITGSDGTIAVPTGANPAANFLGPNVRGTSQDIGPGAITVATPDGIKDIGSLGAGGATNIKLRNNGYLAAFAGEAFTLGTTFSGATSTGIAGFGREFLLGTIQLKVGTAGSQTVINFKKPTSGTAANIGNWWADNDGVLSATGLQSTLANIAIHTGVTVQNVPEPSAFGMVLVGALGLVGFRRLGFRRNS